VIGLHEVFRDIAALSYILLEEVFAMGWKTQWENLGKPNLKFRGRSFKGGLALTLG
jgi:hypothetical protein